MFFIKHSLLLFLFILPLLCYAQVADDFSDDDLTTNPTWFGDLQYFVVENGKLRSGGPSESSEIYLATAFQLTDDHEWNLDLLLDFAPSNSNQFKFVLFANDSDLLNASNILFLEIGQSGDDSFKLIYKEEGVEEVLITGDSLFTGEIELTMKIRLDEQGVLTLEFLQSTGDYITDLQIQLGPIENATYYTGFVCTFTSTRSDLFYFDNFYCGQRRVDITPPFVSSYAVGRAGRTIDLIFSEPVNEDNDFSFLVNNAYLPEALNIEDNRVELFFRTQFSSENTLKISGVTDKAGNIMADTTLFFNFIQIDPPTWNDLIINEFMADPNPPVELPESEYVEVLNISNKNFDLSEFRLNDEVITTQQAIVRPGEFVLLTTAEDSTALSSYGTTYGLKRWDVLANSGDHINLSYVPEYIVVDSLTYTDDWYRVESKSDGGFSLERIFSEYPCSPRYNWAASEFIAGGTPGEPNWVSRIYSDNLPPQLISAYAVDSSLIRIIFDEPINPSSLHLSDIRANLLEFDSIRVQDNHVHLYPTQLLEQNRIYEIEIQDLSDCRNNLFENLLVKVILPDIPEQGDLLINEILFDPYPSGVDYVELINNSEKYFNLENLAFSDDSISLYPIAETSKLIGPHEIMAFSINSEKVASDYPLHGKLMEVRNLPPMNNDKGSIHLFRSAKWLDGLHYHDDMHSKILNDTEGVSLERISVSTSSSNPDNWHSAAATKGFGTPGLENSQTNSKSSIGDVITLSTPYITPDQNGQDDFVLINFNFDSDAVGSFTIYDPYGTKHRTLVNNRSLARKDQFLWDGTNDLGEVVNGGHYILIAEVFTISGESFIFKKKISVIAVN